MSMQKYTTSEKLEVLRGEQAQAVHDARRRTGKASLSDFSKDELNALEGELTRIAKAEKEQAEAAKKDADQSNRDSQ